MSDFDLKKLARCKPKRPFPTEEKRDYMTLAGSGPSAENYPGVDVATKKLTCPAKYQVSRWLVWWHKRKEANCDFMAYKVMECPKYPPIDRERFYQADFKYWDEYFLACKPKRVTKKPSTGTCAVFCMVERWKPDTIGLIGFDWVLDGNDDWNHDPDAELRCIRTLVNVVDLRTGETLPKITL